MKEIDLTNETVIKIVESAMNLFNINGYTGTSISDISKKAELSKGILYHYFQNKDALYLYCAKMCVDEYNCYLEENLLNPILKADVIMDRTKPLAWWK